LSNDISSLNGKENRIKDSLSSLHGKEIRIKDALSHRVCDCIEAQISEKVLRLSLTARSNIDEILYFFPNIPLVTELTDLIPIFQAPFVKHVTTEEQKIVEIQRI